ncbi:MULTISPECIES: hypothetical protein [unclassified Rhizobacter]|uniref:hypothetical protein n=1 Tax=unclassified Rhizobacter TaxID=2640088 RepID=UPI000B1D5173|nr:MULTISPECIES: hypothetical protein [unclassified Rhizobacter]
MNKAWIVGLVAAIGCASVNAATECKETITQVFNHANGDVYFSTDKTCKAGWCQLNGNAEFVKRGYAMLLAAQLAGKQVAFWWRSWRVARRMRPTPARNTCGRAREASPGRQPHPTGSY